MTHTVCGQPGSKELQLYVLERSVFNTTDGCWRWRLHKDSHGYGKALGRRFAHRVSYEVFRGEVGRGLELDHLCRNPECVNPWHLEAVTHRENLQRSPFTLSGANIRKTHCVRGHSLTDSSQYISKVGVIHRHCLYCKRLRRAQEHCRVGHPLTDAYVYTTQAGIKKRRCRQCADARRKQTCIHGHELTEANVRVENGKRRCRICLRHYQRDKRQRRRNTLPEASV